MTDNAETAETLPTKLREFADAWEANCYGDRGLRVRAETAVRLARQSADEIERLAATVARLTEHLSELEGALVTSQAMTDHYLARATSVEQLEREAASGPSDTPESKSYDISNCSTGLDGLDRCGLFINVDEMEIADPQRSRRPARRR